VQILTLSVFVAYLCAPVALITGWIQWARRSRAKTAFSRFSFIGFSLGTASAIFAIGSILYGTAAGGFSHYASALMRIFDVGLLLSLAAFISAICGIWRRGLLRWHAPVLSLAMLLLWLSWIAGE
jgi:hypothetical protein